MDKQASQLLHWSPPAKKPAPQGVDFTTENHDSVKKQTMEAVVVIQRMHGLLPEHLDGEEMSILSKDGNSLLRAEVDTAAPFESVKEAVSLFGECMDWKQCQSSSDEERYPRDFETQQLRKQFVHSREQICLTESSLADILIELKKTREQMQLCRGKAPEDLANGEAFPPLIQPGEAMNGGLPKEVYVSVEDELQMIRNEIERVKKEQSFTASSKLAAVKDYEAYSEARDAEMIRVKELTTELTCLKEALTKEQATLAEAVAKVDELRLAPRDEIDGKSKFRVLKVADKALQTAAAGPNDAKAAAPVVDSEKELQHAHLSLEQVKAAEVDHVAALGRILEELDELKANLTKATEDGASLTSALCSLQSQVASRQSQLESAHETEQIACATLASLQDELCSIRAFVMAAQAGEVKAREAKRTLPTAIKQLAAEADEAKAASKVANEELRKARIELHQIKAAINTTVSWLEAAKKAAEAARASETIALAQFKALSELTDKLAGSDSEFKDFTTVMSLSVEEYQALTLAAEEADEAGNKKIAEIMVQVEAAKASQQDVQGKLEIAVKESEEARKELQQARKKADDAQEAKLEIEANLRKWRAEHEQSRKATPSSVSTSAAQSPRVNGKSVSQGGKSGPLFLQGKTVASLKCFTEVASLKGLSSEGVAKTRPAYNSPKKAEKAKKKSLVARIISLLVIRRKSKYVK